MPPPSSSSLSSPPPAPSHSITPPHPRNPRDTEAQALEQLQHHLTRLFDAHACNICHATLTAPIALPCAHLFCSECARRHLLVHSTCPHPYCGQTATATNLAPLRGLDAMLHPVRQAAAAVPEADAAHQAIAASPVLASALASTSVPASSSRLTQQQDQQEHQRGKYLVALSHKDRHIRQKVTDKLRLYDMPHAGTVTQLLNRYREFVLKWNANIDAAQPQSKQQIIAAVMKHEHTLEAVTAHAPPGATGACPANARISSFFRKQRPPVPASSAFPVPSSRSVAGAATAETPQQLPKEEEEEEEEKDGGNSEEDVVAEGDDFTALIRKTRARKRKRKRELELACQQQAREASLASSLPTFTLPAKKARVEAAPACHAIGALSIVSGVCFLNVEAKKPGALVAHLTNAPTITNCVNANVGMHRPPSHGETAVLRRHRITAGNNTPVMRSPPVASQARGAFSPHVASQHHTPMSSQYAGVAGRNVHPTQPFFPGMGDQPLRQGMSSSRQPVTSFFPAAESREPTVTPPLQQRPQIWSDDVLRRIERNKLRAIALKREFHERQRRQQSQQSQQSQPP